MKTKICKTCKKKEAIHLNLIEDSKYQNDFCSYDCYNYRIRKDKNGFKWDKYKDIRFYFLNGKHVSDEIIGES